MTHINWNDPNPLFINPKFGIDLQGKAPKGIPLPTYGNYGGPNISGPGDHVDALDALFQVHDQAIEGAMSDSKTPGVLTPDELVAAHAELFKGINKSKSDGLIDDAGATLYAGFTIFGLTAQLAQLSLLEELEVALVNFGEPKKAPPDLFDPSNPGFDDVAAALNDARGYMESGLAGLTPEEEGEARNLNGLLSIFENQFEDYFMA